MGSLADLTLGRPSINSYKHGVDDLLDEEHFVNKIDRIHTYLKSLEEERRKIDAFKRELPICMQLLNSAIETSKGELSETYNHHGAEQAATKPESSESVLVDHHEEIIMPMITKRRSQAQNQVDHSRDEKSVTCLDQISGVSKEPKEPIETRFWSPSEAYAHGQEILSSILTKQPHQVMKKRSTPTSSRLAETTPMCSVSNDIVLNPDLSSQKRPRGAFLPFPGKDRHVITRRVDMSSATTTMTTTTTSSVEDGDTSTIPPMFSKLSSRDDNEVVTSHRVDNPPSLLVHDYLDNHVDNVTCAHQFDRASSAEVEEPITTTGTSSLQHHEEVSTKGVNVNSHMNVPMTSSQDKARSVVLPDMSSRKRRRCWSSELHHKFLHALQVLGGSEVATPKLIRELMKVEGLTNDEVKSHLQKYRLHTRRSSVFSEVTTKTQTPQLVVLGGIWVPPPSQSSSEDLSFAATPSLDRQAGERDQDGMNEGCSWIKGGSCITQRRNFGLMHLGLHHQELSYVQNQ